MQRPSSFRSDRGRHRGINRLPEEGKLTIARRYLVGAKSANLEQGAAEPTAQREHTEVSGLEFLLESHGDGSERAHRARGDGADGAAVRRRCSIRGRARRKTLELPAKPRRSGGDGEAEGLQMIFWLSGRALDASRV